MTQTSIGFALKFNDLPDWGNIGALGNRQIDAVRFVYGLGDVGANQTVSRSYQSWSCQRAVIQPLQPVTSTGLFDYKTAQFTVKSRDFSDYITRQRHRLHSVRPKRA